MANSAAEKKTAAASPEQTAKRIEEQIKPLSKNGFLAFFQSVWRKWLSAWYGFSDKHPRLAKLIYQIVFFVIFSEGVTIFQYLVTLFLPMAFGLGLAGKEFLLPKIAMYSIDGVQQYWSLLGYGVVLNKAGEVIIGGGLGYFIAFEIATFLAQIINFPLQRNITFKSHGNPYWQAMWYFIGWIFVSLFCNGVNSLWLPFGAEYLPFAVYNILTMISMGGMAMIIFFFIFRIIFPDYNAVEKRAKAGLEKLKSGGADAATIAEAEAKIADAAVKAKLSNTEKAEVKAITQASSKALTYFAVVRNAEKAGEQAAALGFEEKKAKALDAALTAIAAKDAAITARKAAIAEAGKRG